MINFYFFLVGSILASFLGLVIDRFPEQSIISPASHCDSCQIRLRPLDLIPILSQVLNPLSLSLLQGSLSSLVCPLWTRLRTYLSALLLGIASLGASHPNHCGFDLGDLRLAPSGIPLTGLDCLSSTPNGLLWLESSHGLLPCPWNFGAFYRYPHGGRGFPLSGFLCSRL